MNVANIFFGFGFNAGNSQIYMHTYIYTYVRKYMHNINKIYITGVENL